MIRVLHLLLLFALAMACSNGSAPAEGSPDVLTLADAARDGALADLARPGADALDPAADAPPQPTFWSPELTRVSDDLQYIQVEGERFFALGLHASPGLTYDGVTGPGACDSGQGIGYLDINNDKTHAAAQAGANFVYLWGYSEKSSQMLDVTPRFKGIYHGGYGKTLPVEDDVYPIIYNRYGEVDLDGFDMSMVGQMEAELADFLARTGEYSPEEMPALPPVDQVGHMSWHPTFRMIGSGDGSGEMLTPEEATSLAQALNMMIGDTYTYVENRFDWNEPVGAIMAAATGQKGDIGESYDDWLATDDPDHRSMFDSGFKLANSLSTKGKSNAVVWMWLQGYSFGDSIKHSECKGKPDDSWATGDFPPLRYLVKEATGMIAAGATGVIFFGFPSALPEDAEVIYSFLRAFSDPEVYAPILLSPRLDLDFDPLFMGEEGHDDKGRVHAIVKWDEPSKSAAIVAANPGARETTAEFLFPWTIEQAEILDWESAAFVPSDQLIITDRILRYTFPLDSGTIIRVHPLMAR